MESSTAGLTAPVGDDQPVEDDRVPVQRRRVHRSLPSASNGTDLHGLPVSGLPEARSRSFAWRWSAPNSKSHRWPEGNPFEPPGRKPESTTSPASAGRARRAGRRRCSGTTRMNGEAVSYVTRHAVPSLRSRSRPHPEPTPMTTDERWPPARLRLCPVTHPRTNDTAPSRLHSTPSSRGTSRGFSNGSNTSESHFPTSSEKSSRRTSNAGASNTDSCA